jgi:hypothetical protein
MKTEHSPCIVRALQTLLISGAFLFSFSSARAADHGDAPSLAHDQGADVADLYFFLDPNLNSQAVLVATFHGFIAPGEASNFAIFDPALRYRFEIFNEHVNLAPQTVDPKKIKANQAIDITFSPRVAGTPSDTASGKEILQVAQPQVATVQFTAAGTIPAVGFQMAGG